MSNQNDDLTERADPAGERPGPEAPSGTEKDLPANLPEAYRQLLAEKEQLYDRLLRKQAEVENVRKRVEREKEDFLQHATADLIRALLPTIDSLERALQRRVDGVPEEFYSGLELIHRELLEVLGRAGVRIIPTAGKTFDPHIHQAVEMVETDRYRDQEIVEELQKGYILRHRLLRPAIVKVAVGQGARNAGDADAKAPPE